jgi:hypothetical protein
MESGRKNKKRSTDTFEMLMFVKGLEHCGGKGHKMVCSDVS